MNISKNIIAIREAKRIKQIEVANALNIEQSNYARLEKRDVEMSIKQLSEIAVALGVTVDDILHYGEEKPQIFDNERVKELENKVLLLEKDLEIWRNRYEMKVNNINTLINLDFIYEGTVLLLTHGIYLKEVQNILIDNFHNIPAIIESLNKFTIDYVSKKMIKYINKRFNNKDVILNIYEIFKLLNDNEKVEIVSEHLYSDFAGINLNKEFSQEEYQKKEKSKKSHKTTIVNSLRLCSLEEYKENPNYPPQTGFFRIDNL